VLLTRAFTGLDTNMLRPSIAAAGLDPAALPTRTPNEARKVFGSEGSEPVNQLPTASVERRT
jgi:nitronate monooxygenase